MPGLRSISLVIMILLSFTGRAQVPGCRDPLATNYNALATQNDGSCVYPPTNVTAAALSQLADTIRETSGLLYWNGTFWTHNDDSDTTLYAIDTADGHIVARVQIAGAPNHDWEDLAQDEDFIYIGDFGNNGSGNRQNMSILRLPKPALLHGQNIITPDKIWFSYADQTDFTPKANNSTDFDCEAFVAGADSLYLFTKQWIGGKTKLYALPKSAGTHVAIPQAEYNVDGLVTGAAYQPSRRVIALSGYKISGLSFQPFLSLLYDYQGNHFLSGNKRRILLNPGFHQVEGIATIDGRQFYLTNEELANIVTIPAKLLKVDLTSYLSTWYGSLTTGGIGAAADSIFIYPNPAAGEFSAELNMKVAGALQAEVYNAEGQLIDRRSYWLNAGRNRISLARKSSYPSGNYVVKLLWASGVAWGRVSFY